MSETKRMMAIPASPQRHIMAGLAAVVGGLVAPYERASHIHDRPVLDWLWASGHHPFGPFSNTSSVSHLLKDTAKVSFHWYPSLHLISHAYLKQILIILCSGHQLVYMINGLH